MKELTEKQKQDIAKLDHWVSVQILLESMLFTYMDDNYEDMKKVNPTLANICKKDIYTLRRNHETYIKKFRPILSPVILDDFDKLRELIENFAKMKRI